MCEGEREEQMEQETGLERERVKRVCVCVIPSLSLTGEGSHTR